MVRIVNYIKRQAEDGKEFFVLELAGGIEMVRSSVSGQFYATAKKAYISSTFDEATCRHLIGTEMPGNIIRIDCEPYEYTIKETGEIITLSYRYSYTPEEKAKAQSYGNVKADISTFSMNEQLYELQS